MSQKITMGAALTPEKIAEQLADGGAVAPASVAEYALRLGDDALILSQRLGWWIARAPEIEEDIALGNIALDLIGHARSFLTYAGSAWGKSEDDLAYFRDEPDWRCAQIFELANGDFAHTIVRQFAVSFFQFELYSRLVDSSDPVLAAIAAKAVKEVDYHRDHSAQWMLRLGQGTEESRRRVQVALTDVWPYVDELFRDDGLIDDVLIDDLDGVAVRPTTLREPFDELVGRVLGQADLEVPTGAVARGGGRDGVHTGGFGVLLAEMQVLARQYPGATW
ncbi:1,2-phenylacetyl-CoA epoxidase subunit PaaC [Glaciibacter superstes]|uniref:1,2-phenylacetyl-CoA epoxidase subunit PaaC n=1 Tax=Glaciibacter superstes TaxID=501023 RepID=UPI0003B4F874|nr:1,2-phenylacetyl-CoA epoxidase subunit PaaC [Glaciibacter superstes]